MLPSLTSNDLTNIIADNSVFHRQLRRCVSFAKFIPHLKHLLCCELRESVVFSASKLWMGRQKLPLLYESFWLGPVSVIFTAGGPSLLGRIPTVIGVGSKKKMSWVDAWRIVARMTHPITKGVYSVMKKIRYSTGPEWPSGNIKLTVSSIGSVCGPFPARIGICGSPYLVPEPTYGLLADYGNPLEVIHLRYLTTGEI